MDIVQIICRTVVTTIDIFILLLSFTATVPDSSKKILAIFTMINLVGVWI